MRGLSSHGYLMVGRVAGVPVRLHWTLPVGMALVVGFNPWAWLAYLVVVLAHELGHVWAVRGLGARVEEIGLSGLGGHCRWWGTVGVSGLGLIAWSGVGAQLILLLVWLGLEAALGAPSGPGWAAARSVLVPLNALLIGLNLLPLPGLDGQDAWAAVWELWRRRRATANLRRRAPRRPAPPPRDLDAERAEEEREREVERVFQKMLQELLPPSHADRRDDED